MALVRAHHNVVSGCVFVSHRARFDNAIARTVQVEKTRMQDKLGGIQRARWRSRLEEHEGRAMKEGLGRTAKDI
jgi:hypothetical protein